MAIEKIEAVTLVCDVCNEIFEDPAEGFTIWLDETTAENRAEDNDWYVEDGKHYCAGCHHFDCEDNLILNPKQPKK